MCCIGVVVVVAVVVVVVIVVVVVVVVVGGVGVEVIRFLNINFPQLTAVGQNGRHGRIVRPRVVWERKRDFIFATILNQKMVGSFVKEYLMRLISVN